MFRLMLLVCITLASDSSVRLIKGQKPTNLSCEAYTDSTNQQLNVKGDHFVRECETPPKPCQLSIWFWLSTVGQFTAVFIALLTFIAIAHTERDPALPPKPFSQRPPSTALMPCMPHPDPIKVPKLYPILED